MKELFKNKDFRTVIEGIIRDADGGDNGELLAFVSDEDGTQYQVSIEVKNKTLDAPEYEEDEQTGIFNLIDGHLIDPLE